MIYELILQPEAEQHLEEWKKSGQKKILKKIIDLFSELREHPTTGTGQVEQLKGNLSGFWSRRIDKGSRMVYTIENERVIVTVVSLKGYYGNK
ncbi:MAG: Txe/YoeB family addiction module toxin [Bacteroides sp.]|nr:Txe/YoeB family addiction module toxin [Bacteroides sp.]